MIFGKIIEDFSHSNEIPDNIHHCIYEDLNTYKGYFKGQWIGKEI